MNVPLSSLHADFDALDGRISALRSQRFSGVGQFRVRSESLALSWVGTGRFIFSLNYTESDFSIVADKFMAAARNMHKDGWWWSDATLTNKSIKRRILRELLAQRFR